MAGNCDIYCDTRLFPGEGRSGARNQNRKEKITTVAKSPMVFSRGMYSPSNLEVKATQNGAGKAVKQSVRKVTSGQPTKGRPGEYTHTHMYTHTYMHTHTHT